MEETVKSGRFLTSTITPLVFFLMYYGKKIKMTMRF